LLRAISHAATLQNVPRLLNTTRKEPTVRKIFLLLVLLFMCLITSGPQATPILINAEAKVAFVEQGTQNRAIPCYLVAETVRKKATETTSTYERKDEVFRPEERKKDQEAPPEAVDAVPKKNSSNVPPAPPKGLRIIRINNKR